MNSKKLRELETQLSTLQLKKQNLVLKEDTTIIIEKDSTYTIEILNSLQLTIMNEKESYCEIQITVKKHCIVDIIEFISNKESKYLRVINQQSNSSVHVSQLIFNNTYIKTESNLDYNANYTLKSAYLNDSCESIIINSATHKENDSKSNLLIRGAAKNNSIINNDGIISINPDANNSEGHQSIKNIILDSTTKIHSEPILEIHNHNVFCSHGASTSKIEDEVISYIESRGLTKEQATKMIIEGFFYDSLSSIRKENLDINQKIEEKLLF